MIRLFVPRVNATATDCVSIGQLANIALREPEPVVLDFARCSFVGPNGVALLGALKHEREARGAALAIDTESLGQKLHRFLTSNGSLSELSGTASVGPSSTSIPYRCDREPSIEAIVENSSRTSELSSKQRVPR